jgi:nicotinate-nucleotide adenylyltransferase
MAETSVSDMDLATVARLGIIGGTFDPIHLAHLMIAQEAAIQLDLARVLFIPTGHPPHKQHRPITPAAQRLAMVQRAVADNPLFAVSAIEMEHADLNFTVNTLARLRAQLGPTPQFFLIVGGDMVYDMVTWRDPAGIVQQVAGIAAVERPGFTFDRAALLRLEAQVPGLGLAMRPVTAPLIAISSTQVRERLAQHLPIRYWVPGSVETYIREQDLYDQRLAVASEESAP